MLDPREVPYALTVLQEHAGDGIVELVALDGFEPNVARLYGHLRGRGGPRLQQDISPMFGVIWGAARALVDRLVALGPELAPYYCNDAGLVEALENAAEREADPVWRMPLWRGYDQMLSSPIADVNHISGGSFAGSITAALFLKRFTPEDGRWMHFDIYAWRPKAAPGRPAGGEAQAIRALFGMLEARYGA